MKVIEGMVMPTGWHFMQDGQTRIDAATFKDLAQAVLEWRLQNRVPVGNVALDVERFICSKYPAQCHPEGFVQMRPRQGQPHAPTNPSKRSDALTKWALEMQKKPGIADQVPEQEANARAMTCIACKQNISWPRSCARCHDEVERLLTMLRGGRDVTHWRKLNICSATEQDCRSIVWLKKDLLRRDRVPSNCWLK